MSTSAAAGLTLAEAVPLGYALSSEVARTHGIRAVAIKGPVTSHFDLRETRQPADVDVWIDPQRFSRFLNVMTSIGWMTRIRTAPSAVRKYSEVLTHPLWPCEVDVHHAFPGFLNAEQAVFEVIWKSRITLQIAGHGVQATGLAASVAVHSLHLARDEAKQASEIAAFASRLEQLLDRAAISELEALVSETQASLPYEVTNSLRLTSAPAPCPPDRGAQRRVREWRVRTALTDQGAAHLLMQLQRTPWRQWPSTVWRATILTTPEIRRRYPYVAPTTSGIFRARVRRLLRGLTGLPRALVLVVRARWSAPNE